MKKYLVLAVILFGLLPLSSIAAEIKAGENYTSGVGEVVTDDLYVAAGMLSIGGNVEGDLVAAGGRAVVGGNITEDLLLVGGDAIVIGNIGEDARVAGGNVTLSGNVGGDLVTAGGNVQVASTSTIEGDVVAGAGVLIIDGIVNGNVKVGSGALIINGQINGDIEAEAEEVQFGKNAIVAGDVTYKAFTEAKIEEGAQLNGTINFEERERGTVNQQAGEAIFAFIGAAWLVKLLMQLAVALVLLWFAPRALSHIATRISEKFSRELLRGFIFLVVTPIAVILLMVSVIGIMLAIPIILLYSAMLIIAKVLAAVVLGEILWKWFKLSAPAVNWKSIVLGVVVINIVSLVPVLGWIVVFLLFCASLGSLSNHLYQHLSNAR